MADDERMEVDAPEAKGSKGNKKKFEVKKVRVFSFRPFVPPQLTETCSGTPSPFGLGVGFLLSDMTSRRLINLSTRHCGR